MIRRLEADADGFAAALAKLLQMPAADDIQSAVSAIIRRVRDEGDAALLEYGAKFDDFRPASSAGLYASAGDIAAARKTLSPPVLSALKSAAARVRAYHRRQKPRSWQRTDACGNVVGERIAPVSRAAVYAPGGRAAYPSSVLMGVIPAKVAGVSEIILMTPATGRRGIAADFGGGGNRRGGQSFIVRRRAGGCGGGIRHRFRPPRRCDCRTGKRICRRSKTTVVRTNRRGFIGGTVRSFDS